MDTITWEEIMEIMGISNRKELLLTYGVDDNSTEFSWFLNNIIKNPEFSNIPENQDYKMDFNDDNTMCILFLTNSQINALIMCIEIILINDNVNKNIANVILQKLNKLK